MFGVLFDRYCDDDGKWWKCDDVLIYFNVDEWIKVGKFGVGFGGGFDGNWIGFELVIGMVFGDYFDEKVLLIKVVWGGKDLYCDFCFFSVGEFVYFILICGD